MAAGAVLEIIVADGIAEFGGVATVVDHSLVITSSHAVNEFIVFDEVVVAMEINGGLYGVFNEVVAHYLPDSVQVDCGAVGFFDAVDVVDVAIFYAVFCWC